LGNTKNGQRKIGQQKCVIGKGNIYETVVKWQPEIWAAENWATVNKN